MKKFLLSVLVLVLILVAVGFVLPGSVHIERSVVIDAPPAQVFPYVSDFERFNEWSPWARRDPNTRYTFNRTSGVGARMEWSSEDPDVGSGSQEYTEVRDNEFVKVALDFGDMGQANATHQLTPAEGGTRVTWGFDSEFGNNLIFRYFGLMMDRWVGADYEQGLANLKAVVESQPAPVPESEPDRPESVDGSFEADSADSDDEGESEPDGGESSGG